MRCHRAFPTSVPCPNSTPNSSPAWRSPAILAAAHNAEQVNLVNAPAVAKALGLDVTESTVALATNCTELIEVSAVKGGEVCTVAGTFYGKSARIVHIAGHNVETSPAGRFLFVENDDRPGIVGLIGGSLGEAQVNIANMALSRNADRTRAVTVIEVDTEPPAALLEKLRSTPGIIRVLSFELVKPQAIRLRKSPDFPKFPLPSPGPDP